jgi:hypothetical protein
MKIFLDDFIVYHLQKLILCFQKCKEYGISLNPDKCAFMVFLRTILGFIVSKEGKILDPKKIQAIINMPPPKNPQEIQSSIQWDGTILHIIKNFDVIISLH